LRDFFEVVAASLVVGVEKPDPRIFDWTLARLGVEPKDCLHIGDSEEDDAVGAQNAGIPYRLIDRANPIPHGISNLGEILELIQWTA
jgi:HAD superfamily hydrolase (TIGR01509 family)